jgi:hypothetical protein
LLSSESDACSSSVSSPQWLDAASFAAGVALKETPWAGHGEDQPWAVFLLSWNSRRVGRVLQVAPLEAWSDRYRSTSRALHDQEYVSFVNSVALTCCESQI